MRTRRFESREESFYCGFEGKYTLNRAAVTAGKERVTDELADEMIAAINQNTL